MAASCGCQSGGQKVSRSLEEGLECPVCWEGFDDGENTPYVLWCGHSLCKTCVVSLDWATVKLSGLPLQLPLFVACPWCQFLTFRCKWRGQLRYPCKNFFLLWVVESLQQGDHGRKGTTTTTSPVGSPARRPPQAVTGAVTTTTGRVTSSSSTRWVGVTGGWRRSGTRVATSLVQFTARIPLILLFLFIVVYVLPFSTLVLALYCLITVLFAVPSFLVVYFSYPSLDWLVRAIASG